MWNELQAFKLPMNKSVDIFCNTWATAILLALLSQNYSL